MKWHIINHSISFSTVTAASNLSVHVSPLFKPPCPLSSPILPRQHLFVFGLLLSCVPAFPAPPPAFLSCCSSLVPPAVSRQQWLRQSSLWKDQAREGSFGYTGRTLGETHFPHDCMPFGSAVLALDCILHVFRLVKRAFWPPSPLPQTHHRTVRSSSTTRRQGRWTPFGTRQQSWGRVDWHAVPSHQRSRENLNRKGGLLTLSRSWNMRAWPFKSLPFNVVSVAEFTSHPFSIWIYF